MDPTLLSELEAAIDEVGHCRFGPAAAAGAAKDRARGALIAFGQQPLPVAIREAATFLGYRLDDMQSSQSSGDWEPLLHALQDLEREIVRSSRS